MLVRLYLSLLLVKDSELGSVCIHRTKPCQQQMTLALSIAGVLRERHHDTLYD